MAIQFLTLSATGKVDEAYDRYVSDSFRHHNQYFPAGRDSLQAAMNEAASLRPNRSIDIRLAVEEGSFVTTYSRVVRVNGEEIAVAHIFRFADNLIAELWDLGQIVRSDSPNTDGVF